MKLCDITEYGIFNTDYAFPGKKGTEGRLLTEFQIEYFISCNGKVRINDTVYPLEAGTVLCSKPGQIRSSRFGFRCYYIHFTLPEHSPYMERLMNTPDFYRIVDSTVYGKIFEEMIRHLILDGYDAESDYLNAKLLELFYFLEKDAEQNRNYSELSTSRQNPWIPKVLHYLKENLSRSVSLSDMARQTGYSAHYFHQIFTSVMGVTPQQYLLRLRISRGKELLAGTDLSLAQVAYECGFSSQSYFCLQFRRQTDLTPRQYRKVHMEKYVP